MKFVNKVDQLNELLFANDNMIMIILFIINIILIVSTTILFSISHIKKHGDLIFITKYLLIFDIVYNISIVIVTLNIAKMKFIDELLLAALLLVVINFIVKHLFTLVKQISFFLLILLFIIISAVMIKFYFFPLINFAKHESISNCVKINLAMWILIFFLDYQLNNIEYKFLSILLIIKPVFIASNFFMYFLLLYLNDDLINKDQSLLNKLVLIFTVNVSCVTLIPEIVKYFNYHLKNVNNLNNNKCCKITHKKLLNLKKFKLINNLFKYINKIK